MYLRHLGYACSNVTLGCTTGRTFRLANLSDVRVTETVAANLEALSQALRWNVRHGIFLFRISSDVVPFASHEQFTFDWETAFATALAEVRTYVQDHGLRLSMHPGQYTVLNSPRPDVVEAAIRELDYHAAFIEAVDPWQGTLTLHVGGAYGDKAAAVERFEQNVGRLSARARRRLILENDDKTYHLDDVLPLCERLGLPMVFDHFHHRCHHPGASPDAGLHARLERVVATWGGAVPKMHLSSGKPDGPRTAHADYVRADDLDALLDLMDGVGGDAPFDLMLEAKQKDQAVLALIDRITLPMDEPAVEGSTSVFDQAPGPPGS